MFITRLVKALNSYSIPYAIVGGQALAIHGAVRGTIDVDFITKWNLKNLKLIHECLIEFGLQPRLPITPEDLFNFKDEYIKNRNLIAWNYLNPKNPSEIVDIIITTDLKNKKLKKINLLDVSINVLSIPDLIQMKKNAGREQDLIDIKALEKIYEN